MASGQLGSLIPHDSETPLLRSITLRSCFIMKETLKFHHQAISWTLPPIPHPSSPISLWPRHNIRHIICYERVMWRRDRLLMECFSGFDEEICQSSLLFLNARMLEWKLDSSLEVFFFCPVFMRVREKKGERKVQWECEKKRASAHSLTFFSLLWHFLSSFPCCSKAWGTRITTFF